MWYIYFRQEKNNSVSFLTLNMVKSTEAVEVEHDGNLFFFLNPVWKESCKACFLHLVCIKLWQNGFKCQRKCSTNSQWKSINQFCMKNETEEQQKNPSPSFTSLLQNLWFSSAQLSVRVQKFSAFLGLFFHSFKRLTCFVAVVAAAAVINRTVTQQNPISDVERKSTLELQSTSGRFIAISCIKTTDSAKWIICLCGVERKKKQRHTHTHTRHADFHSTQRLFTLLYFILF